MNHKYGLLDVNVEQAREVFHVAHENLFAVIEQVKLPHTTVCQSVKISEHYSSSSSTSSS